MVEYQLNLVAKFLKENAGKEFNVKEIARALISMYPEKYEAKRKKSNLTSEQLLATVRKEIYAIKREKLLKLSVNWNDFQKPRLYSYHSYEQNTDGSGEKNFSEIQMTQKIKEHDLYQPLMEYLSVELDLQCMRIRENTSKNSMGHGANQWLHPDIVAMQPLDKDWNKEVKECLRESGSSNIRLWSFEVKKVLNFSNLRQSFFQAVSNSSWANEGYLVATQFGPNVEQELRILSSLHGIGIIKLNIEETSESEILLPSARRTDVDWQSVNRIVRENNDFKSFIKNVYTYFKTGNLELKIWNQ